MMRNWLNWKQQDKDKDDDKKTSSQHQQQQQQPVAPPQSQEESGGRLTRGSRGLGQPQPPERSSVIQTLMASRSSAAADAEMERRVSISARNLGDGVSRIVLAARMGGGREDNAGEWKVRLLNLLGGEDTATAENNTKTTAASGEEKESDIDILLQNSSCERFVLRCVENELPPNLIHCLRLLRVLELQHDHAVAKARGRSSPAVEGGGDDDNTNTTEVVETLHPGPVSTNAAKKVSRLLSLLCSDSSVGEQLRPHLFGLLALSGASYPASGVHIANAASEVILAFSSHCLSASLVWFLHDRKMIVHMTDDIKELCGMTPVSANSGNHRCLYGQEAEKAGLWVVALKTVVHLVADSCHYQCVELLKDFDSAGGYHALAFAIGCSGENHVPRLLELVTALVCCKIGSESPVKGLEGGNDGGLEGSVESGMDLAESKVAMNTNAFEIMDDLMMKSIPFLKAYKETHDGRRPSFDAFEDFADMADFSVQYGWELLLNNLLHDKKEDEADLISELLVTTLQLYSDHAKNFDLIESEYHMLSHYILAFPTLSDVSVKVLTLKTLEYVCTGLAKANSLVPLRVSAEVFMSLSKRLTKAASRGDDSQDNSQDEVKNAFDTSLMNLQMICDTLTKLLEFDENVIYVMLDCGLLGSFIDDMLDLIMVDVINFNSAADSDEGVQLDYLSTPTPQKSTRIDEVYDCACRIVKLVVRQPSARATMEGNGSSSADIVPCDSSLESFLTAGILHLGDKASQSALSVFEAMMIKNHDELLKQDTACLVSLLNKFATQSVTPIDDADEDASSKQLDVLFVDRQCQLMDILKTILSSNREAQDVFRASKGFECIVRIFFQYSGTIRSSDDTETQFTSEITAMMNLLESAFSLISSATSPKVKEQKSSSEEPTQIIDVLIDDSESASKQSYTVNLKYLRMNGFYIELATVISETGIIYDISNARAVMNLALELIHPRLMLNDGRRPASEAKALTDNISIHNADASRLVLGLSIRLRDTESHKTLAKNAFDELLRLCANDMAGSSLARLASSGLCSSLTSQNEFAFMLDDRTHFLYSRFVLLLRRIAAFRMTYNDFVSLLRCVAGPIILADQYDGEDDESLNHSPNKRIRLNVISSSVQAKKPISTALRKSEAWQSRETGFCNRLETLSVIAERGDRVPRCEVGGDTLNSISMYMQNIPLEERLYSLAEQGRLRFVEIESLDASAKSSASTSGTIPQSSQSNPNLTVWNPLVSTGFTYCVWLRQHHPIKDGSQCSLFVFDISSPPTEKLSDGSVRFGSSGHDFLSFWYDVTNQRFCVLTSSNSRGEPTCFPTSPLPAGVWHHIQLTYQAPKRTMLGRKAVLTLFIDGRPVEAEAKVDAFNIPPTARVHIGVPNPILASSGIVRGSLPVWDLGPTLLLSTVLSLRDATAMYTAGPDFPGLFWGDRPQRLSLASTATAAFVMLAENGEKGSVAGALRRRKVPSMEAVGHVMRERGFSGGPVAGPESDSLSAVGLLCKVAPENVVFGYQASSATSTARDGFSSTKRSNYSRRLINISQISACHTVSTDATVYGYSSIISPHCFADNVQWIGGPNILLPIVNAAQSSSSLSMALRMIRESVRRHPPNLEMLQAGGGYRMLALLLRQKRIMDVNVLDQCFAFAVHGFVPGFSDKDAPRAKNKSDSNSVSTVTKSATYRWVFADLDAMKYLLLNHQVWDLSGSGPDMPLRLLTYFNGLVVAHSTHAAFNSRRLHLLGIIRWTLHLMLEATELYAAGASASFFDSQGDESRTPDGLPQRVTPAAAGALKNGWFSKPTSVSKVAAGADPGNELLLGCKTLLRRVLTFMLTPGDLEAIAGAAIYTVSITGGSIIETNPEACLSDSQSSGLTDTIEEKLAPGAIARVHLLRLLEELVVDGVNEIVLDEAKPAHEPEGQSEAAIEPHSGGSTRKKNDPRPSNPSSESSQNPKHQEAQIFLSAFAGILTPVWFACILEGCREEGSASAVLRLMILMIQNSRKFANSFEDAGGFAPLVLSIPKFSTCPSIMLSMLSHLLNAPILHLPNFASLDIKQLCEVFDAESDSPSLIHKEDQGRVRSSDPSCGIFALLAECLGRNIQLASFENELGRKARNTNECILQLLSHRHAFSSHFQAFCRTPDFLEPLAQALCLVHDENLHTMFKRNSELSMDGEFSDTPCEAPQGVGRRSPMSTTKNDDDEGTGIGMVQLLHLVLSHAVLQGPLAAPLVCALFRSFPIHASPDQVEAFYLVLIERCQSVVEDALQRGEPIAIANCIGLSSVLLDRLISGFFTPNPVLQAVSIAMLTLNSLTSSGTYASRLLANIDQNMLVADAAHIARLTCLTALQRCRPVGAYDTGDVRLKLAILTKIGDSMRQLLLVPSNLLGSHSVRKQGGYPIPPPTSRFFPLWQSASLSRCCPPSISCSYPDITVADEPDRSFVIALMADIHGMLQDRNKDVREQAVVVIVSLLQRRRGIMSELLITDIPRSDGRAETVDLMNRGGFGALLGAHDATKNAENDEDNSATDEEECSKYSSFFEWFERNQDQIAAVFHGIHIQASRVSIPSTLGAATPEEAIENEQKVMLLKLTSQDSSDRTILGGLERAELARRSHDATAESHALWKRQGFDDLSSGAMQWKFLLRQLKGSCSLWEGGTNVDESLLFGKSVLVASLLQNRDECEGNGSITKYANESETVKRWKLDLTEGYERQRRRLLPNYEFHGLYNIDEKVDNVEYTRSLLLDGEMEAGFVEDGSSIANESEVQSQVSRAPSINRVNSQNVIISPADMEVTADLLKKMKLEKMHDNDDDDFEVMEDEDNDFEETMHTQTVRESSLLPSELEEKAKNDGNEVQVEGDKGEDAKAEEGEEAASSYDLITGLLKAGDWPEKSYNVSRCTGLEVRKALLLWCRNALYVVDGFEQTDGEGLKGKINRLKKETTSFKVNIRQHGGVVLDQTASREPDRSKAKDKSASEGTDEEITYQHRSQRIAFTDLYSVYRRRYQLQQNALEFYDVHRNGTLVAFTTHEEREEVLTKVLSTPLPSSIFSSSILGGSTSINYKKFMNNLRAKITSQWVQGKMTNFEFIMHINSFAGRTYNDLTQYPVVPWVLADYESEELDLNDPKSFRDLSKPMGAQGETRAVQFRERYEALEQGYEMGDGPPPFHYGTHYSCAAYVLYYLMRLEPFSRLALALQGGKFDVADRLFHNVGSSWNSASSENLQDVRELIPEFYYLPDFLVNSNMFDFGATQVGKTVHDATLPPWAKGDPKRFIRLHRQALESDYVSRNLHQWLDLVFGFKQRGKEAVAALNTFVHVTYEGQVDLDSITDPIERESIIAQIQNFGQTPSRLERKPFPQRVVVSAFKEKGVDFNAISSLAALTPPFCVVGAPHRVHLRVNTVDTCKVGMSGQTDSSVGDIFLNKGQIIGVGRTCALIIPSKKYIRFGGPNNGVSVHVAVATTRHREVNKVLSIHDGMHRSPISVAQPSLNGLWLVTGCVDSTVRVWKYNGQNMQLQSTLCGHDGGKITCLDISTTYGTIVTGGSDGKILEWDLRTLTFLRQLIHLPTTTSSTGTPNDAHAAKSVSINHKNGNIVTLIHSNLCVFDINGNLVAKQSPEDEFEGNAIPSCVVATGCPEWMENGIVAVTGHMNGDVRLWSIDYDCNLLVLRHLLPERIHSCPITVLRIADEKEDTLLIGDKSGKISMCSTLKLEQMSGPEQAALVAETQSLHDD
ncbi:hypothetical protein ACHAXN_011851 [Cyclotella atomus]